MDIKINALAIKKFLKIPFKAPVHGTIKIDLPVELISKKIAKKQIIDEIKKIKIDGVEFSGYIQVDDTQIYLD